MIGSPLICMENLGYRYPDGGEALRGITVTVAAGEKVALVGGNGAGKTTLLLHLNGCLLATIGSIAVGGLQVVRQHLASIRQSVGLVFKDPDDQLFMPTVAEDVAFGPLNQGFAKVEVEQRVVSALTAMDAEHLLERSPLRLSAGEKRRVAIATVLAMQPSVLVMDEPTDGLDPWGRRHLIALLSRLEQTLLLASHDLDFVAQTCQRVLVLHEGRLLADMRPSELFRDSALLAACRLEPPLSLQGCPVCNARLQAQ